MYRRLQARSPFLLVGLGATLCAVAVSHHVTEFLAIPGSGGPLLALGLDGLPALGLTVAGYRLMGTDVKPQDRLSIVGWSLGGSTIVVGVMGATMFVRLFEGRSLAEPVFPLLVALEIGAIAGLVAGYYNTRARADERRARAVSEAMGFVNDLIRHDLRNDLTVIQGHARLLPTDDTDTDTSTHHSRTIETKATEALERLETTRAVADTLVGDPDVKPVDVAAITDRLATQLETVSGVTVRTDIDEAAVVSANVGLRSVLDNLLENAVEHNDANGPCVWVSVDDGPETVSVTIRDNGPGMSPEARSALIDHDGRKDRGGLSMVNTLVERYDGTLHVTTNEPRGTTVEVELPRARETASSQVTT